jgi:ABC-type nitrate/sulfonate/bicarbonate transport system substrate-binding protein
MADLWFTRCPVPTATGLAADQGWFDDAFAADGTVVRSLQDGAAAAGGAGLRAEHFSHELTSLIREGGNVPALWARSRGADTRLVGLTWIDERQAIVVRGDDDLHDPAQLGGRRVAIPARPGESIDFWRAMALAGFAGALRIAGLGLTSVDLVDVAPHADTDGSGASGFAPEVQAVIDGRADAAYVKGAPGLEAATRAGARIAIDLDDVPDRATRVNNGTPRPITVHQELLETRRDDVVRFVAVLLRAADWAAENPAEVAEVLARETHARAESVAGAYRDAFHRSLHPSLDDERLVLLAQQKDFLLGRGFLEADVDLDAWVDHTTLAAARDLTLEGAHQPHGI